MATPYPHSVVLTEGAHQPAFLTLAVPIQTKFDDMTWGQLPAAGNAQAVAVIVFALAGVGEQFIAAVFHRTLQGQRCVTLFANSRRLDGVSIVFALLHLQIGVPVVTQVMGDLQAWATEIEAAVILFLPGNLSALWCSFMDFHGLKSQLLAHRHRLIVAERGQADVERFTQTAQTTEGLRTLRRVQVGSGQQCFDLLFITAAQSLFNELISFNLQALSARPFQPQVFLRLLIGRIETRQQTPKPQVKHGRRTILPLRHFAQRFAG